MNTNLTSKLDLDDAMITEAWCPFLVSKNRMFFWIQRGRMGTNEYNW
jgi:hypothetical protein